MAANPPLIQPGDVGLLGTKISLSNYADAGLIELLCGEVSDMARSYCTQEWWINSYNEQYFGRNNKVLMLKHRPVTGITSLTVADEGGNFVLSPAPTDVNGNPIPSQVSATQNYANYWFDYRGIYLGTGSPFPDNIYPNIYVIYTAGYASLTGGPNGSPDYASIPADLKMALIKEVVFRYEESKRVGLKSVSDGNQQTSTYSTGPLDPQCAQILNKYKRTWGAGL